MGVGIKFRNVLLIFQFYYVSPYVTCTLIFILYNIMNETCTKPWTHRPGVLSGLGPCGDGEVLELRHPEQYAAYIWIPSASTILGGTALSSGIHGWTADTQTVQSRSEWRHILTEMQTLNVKNVIPGHYLGARPAGSQAVDFTLNYLKSFEAALAQHKTSAQVITAMKAAWPKLAEPASLELSAKVNTGEMKW